MGGRVDPFANYTDIFCILSLVFFREIRCFKLGGFFLLDDLLRGEGVLLDGVRVRQLLLVEGLDRGLEAVVLPLGGDGWIEEIDDQFP